MVGATRGQVNESDGVGGGSRGQLLGSKSILRIPAVHGNQFAGKLTSEWETACTDSSMRLCTPTLRIIFAMCAFTVRSTIPRGSPISLLERPATNLEIGEPLGIVERTV